MEELVNKLANLQTVRKEFEDRADNAVRQMRYDKNIHNLEMELKQQKELRDSIRRPFEDEMSKIDEEIEDISKMETIESDMDKFLITFEVFDIVCHKHKFQDTQENIALFQAYLLSRGD